MHRSLASVGVPALHILRANNGEEYRFYELTGDLSEALHFRHFTKTEELAAGPARGRIRFKGEVVQPSDTLHIKVHGRVKLR